MGAIKLHDLKITSLRRIETAGGDVLHAMKQSDLGFAGFGEAYFSCVNAGAVKGWKRHKLITMNLVVPLGRVRFVFCQMDDHNKPEFRVEEIGLDRYIRATIPAGIWFAFQGMAEPQSLVLNIASAPHDPNEVERINIDVIDYAWS